MRGQLSVLAEQADMLGKLDTLLESRTRQRAVWEVLHYASVASGNAVYDELAEMVASGGHQINRDIEALLVEISLMFGAAQDHRDTNP